MDCRGDRVAVNRSVTCYPIPGKRKALLLCEAFAAGVRAAGGTAHVCTEPPRELASRRRGVLRRAPGGRAPVGAGEARGRDWYYIDNSYFDAVRERQFRVTKNAIQHTGQGARSAGASRAGRRHQADARRRHRRLRAVCAVATSSCASSPGSGLVRARERNLESSGRRGGRSLQAYGPLAARGSAPRGAAGDLVQRRGGDRRCSRACRSVRAGVLRNLCRR
jgi:hypothetical protein